MKTNDITCGIAASIFALINAAPDQIETIDDVRLHLKAVQSLITLHDQHLV